MDRAALIDFQPKHPFLVALDSDGTVFDTMELKHKECFIPATIRYWQLQAVSRYARQVAEFVNLYSRYRGLNRFPALIITLDLLRELPEVQARGTTIPIAQTVRDWIERETRLGTPALKAEVERTGDPVLGQALAWTEAINRAVADILHDVPPFPTAREALLSVAEWADLVVCSTAPTRELEREWEEHDLASLVTVIAGQEMGSKKEHLHLAASGKYDKTRVIMIGDAPADLEAARSIGARFFPINPGFEEQSWQSFRREAAGRFRSDTYSDEYQAEWVDAFENLLPENPPWIPSGGRVLSAQPWVGRK